MRTLEVEGLTIRLVGGTDREGGGSGPLLVLLHGFGAPGDDLVPLHRVLDVPREVRFAFLHAPHALPWPMGDGRARAWWMIDVEGLERAIAEGRARDLSKERPDGLDAALRVTSRAIEALRAQLGPSKLVLGGFSQGAMLSTAIALETDASLDGLVLMSGTLLDEERWTRLMTRRAGMPTMISHGTHDPILPFDGSERLAAAMRTAGVAVDFVKFRGQHEIPPVVLEHAATLIRSVVG